MSGNFHKASSFSGFMLQVTHAAGITAPNRTFLEVAFEDVDAGKRIAAKNAHVGAIAGVCGVLSKVKIKIKIKGNWTYVVEGGAEGAWHEGKSSCNADKETFRQHPFADSSRESQ
jgi:hypothetical protein